MRKFTFFVGISKPTLTATWSPILNQDLNIHYGIDVVEDLSRILSAEISRTIDEDIIRTLTREINGGLRA
jgi:hypothetical protein